MNGRGAASAVLLVLLASCGENAEQQSMADGDPKAGRATVLRTECGICHIIPGISGARGTVGPSLEEFARRNYIAGRLPNEPEQLARWVRSAPDFAPDTAMPHLPLTEKEARDVAAFLYTLR